MELIKIQARAKKRREKWKLILKEKGWTQSKLAKHLGVTKSYVSRELKR